MIGIYRKAQYYNEQTRQEYIKAAAYSESISNETYNLEFANNLDCFSKEMGKYFTPSNSDWLQNHCTKPLKINTPLIENKFITKDVQYSNIAKSKFVKYQKTKYLQFLDAAISFAAAAAKTNPTARYFYQLGNYYEDLSTVLALSNYITANAYDNSFFNDEQNEKLNKLKKQAESEIGLAIKNNNQEFLNAFLFYGLDKVVQINKKSILLYSLELDRPDAMQTILNKYIDNKTADEVQKRIHKTIILCAINNSPKCIQRFIDLGVEINFTLNNEKPLNIAEKVLAEDAYLLILNNSYNKTTLLDKFKTSPVNLLLMAKTDPIEASKKLEENLNPEEVNSLVNRMVSDLHLKPYYITVLGNSNRAKKIIDTNTDLQFEIKEEFLRQLFLSPSESKAYLFISKELIKFNKLPSLNILFDEKIDTRTSSVKRPRTTEDEIGYLLDYEKYNFENYKKRPDLFPSNGTVYKTSIKRINELVKLDKQIGNLSEKDIYDLHIKFYSAVNHISLYEPLAKKYPHFTKCIDPIKLPVNISDSLALIALKFNNTNLFKVIDDKYDLSKAQNADGQPLFLSMLNMRFTPNLSMCSGNDQGLLNDPYTTFNYNLKEKRKVFLSKDFDFDEDINGQSPFKILIENFEKNYYPRFSTSFALENLKNVINTYQINLNKKITENGGTILHWYVIKMKLIVTDSETMGSNKTFIQSDFNQTIDKSIKNNNGLTAYELYKLNQDIIRQNANPYAYMQSVTPEVKSQRKQFEKDWEFSWQRNEKRIFNLIK